MLSKDAVRQALAKVQDPELKKPLTDLDMVKSIDIADGMVTVRISLTAPGCPFKEKIHSDVTAVVSRLPEVKSVRVEFDVMSKEQLSDLKKRLGVSQDSIAQKEAISKAAKHFIAVASGKGGVGKSTVTSNLAAALARLGYRVGVLDADVYGFSIPRMLGVSGQPTMVNEKIIPLNKGDNLQVVSMGFFVGEDEPVIWRGPLLHKAIIQFLSDVAWTNLDYLFLDLPPGTGDVALTIAQSVPTAELLVVTTPQVTATLVAGRVAKLAEKTNLRVIGVIENMSYLETNGVRQYIFGKEGGKHLSEKLNVNLLGSIPIMQSIREGADTGNPVATDGSPEAIALFETIARSLLSIDQP